MTIGDVSMRVRQPKHPELVPVKYCEYLTVSVFSLPSKQGTISEPVGRCHILVHNWYCSTSMCFHVYSREYTCSACCHEFWTSLTRVVLGQNWYGFTGTCHHVKKLVISREARIDTPNLLTESGVFTWIEPVELVNSLTEQVKSRVLICWVPSLHDDPY